MQCTYKSSFAVVCNWEYDEQWIWLHVLTEALRWGESTRNPTYHNTNSTDKTPKAPQRHSMQQELALARKIAYKHDSVSVTYQKQSNATWLYNVTRQISLRACRSIAYYSHKNRQPIEVSALKLPKPFELLTIALETRQWKLSLNCHALKSTCTAACHQYAPNRVLTRTLTTEDFILKKQSIYVILD